MISSKIVAYGLERRYKILAHSNKRVILKLLKKNDGIKIAKNKDLDCEICAQGLMWKFKKKKTAKYWVL